jgi:hypothetical protein
MSDINDPENWTRGDPLAPPHVKTFWQTPDHDTFPDDASDDNPYYWDPFAGAWLTPDNITEPS